MLIRSTITSLLIFGAAMFAQPPGRGPGGPLPRFLGPQPGMPGRVVKNAPYSADVVTENTQTLADGNHIKQTTTSKFFRDSDGRTRREQSLDSLTRLAPNAEVPKAVVFINDPVAGVNLALNPSDRTVVRSSSPRGDGRGP